MSKTDKQELGAWGEEEAVSFLMTNGYDIIERNYQVRKGEIDIIAWHEKYHWGKTLCFVEVKTRSYGEGNAEQATGAKKQGSIIHTARLYCLEHDIDIDHTPIQFEQVSVYVTRKKPLTARCELRTIIPR